MLRLVYRKRLGNAILEICIVIFPARVQLLQPDTVGQISVDCVSGQVYERTFRRRAASRLKEIESSDGIGVEVVEGDRRCPIMGGPGDGMDDRSRLELSD